VRPISQADRAKRSAVRRMKFIAAGFLLAATVLYLIGRWQSAHGAGWAGYLEAAAEAAMVGALADWFAVTALFRHPLGLPIPHTAIIPKRKAALGASLGEFVGENFLSGDVVRARLRTIGLSGRLGAWLSDPDHADLLAQGAGGVLRGALAIMRDEEVQSVVGGTVNRWLESQPVGPPAGRMLARFVARDGHRPLVDLLSRQAVSWLELHPESIERAVASEAPGWTPRFVDERVARRIHRELIRFAAGVRDDPRHPARASVDRFLTDFAADLTGDPATMDRAEKVKRDLIAHPEVQRLVGSLWERLRSMTLAAVDAPDGETRARLRQAIAAFGARLCEDEHLRAKLDGWIEGAAVHLVTGYRGEITALITDTVEAWDAQETSRKIELQVGRDLQFIRINGTVVGALAGLVIYALSRTGWFGP
jgi:uncharacterized membrane-anchored protein YjiN (DUF445 family)